MSKALALAMALLAAISIVAQMAAKPVSTSDTLFAQGALSSLVSAEKAVKEGRAETAFSGFRLALLRAGREGRGDLAERVRWGMLSAGKRLAEEDLAKGWLLLSQACVLSPRFGVTALSVEAWVLSQHPTHHEFAYWIAGGAGSKAASAWGTVPQTLHLWLPRRFPRAARHLVRVPFVSQEAILSVSADSAFVKMFAMTLDSASEGAFSGLVFIPGERGGAPKYVGVNSPLPQHRLQPIPDAQEAQGGASFRLKQGKPISVLFVGVDRKGDDVTVQIQRLYEAL